MLRAILKPSFSSKLKLSAKASFTVPLLKNPQFHCCYSTLLKDTITPPEDDLGLLKSKIKQLRKQPIIENQTIELENKLQGTKKIVLLAMSSNLIMFSAKFYGALSSGSASILLMYGLWRSLKQPDLDHPYGYMTEKYAWALVSGVGVFFLGGGVTLYHGISGLIEGGHVLHDLQPAFMALGATLTVAYSHIKRSAREKGLSFFEFLKKGADPTSVQVFMEDSAALMGILIAGTCLSVSKLLLIPWLDSVGSIAIGLLLSSVAVWLVRRNINGLIQTRMDKEKETEIVNLIVQDPVIKSVHDVKSTSIGPDWARFKAEIMFDAEKLVRKYQEMHPHRVSLDIELLKECKSDQEVKEWLVNQSSELLFFVGREIDRIELLIRKKRPEVKHIDLEIL
ncbi:hypothetical protein HDV06_004462 [Boothiomyces sp. JEL0866]|nr:hypothetical protein HDV06_004462 [Boothiomyces sp. JEL0866]